MNPLTTPTRKLMLEELHDIARACNSAYDVQDAWSPSETGKLQDNMLVIRDYILEGLLLYGRIRPLDISMMCTDSRIIDIVVQSFTVGYELAKADHFKQLMEGCQSDSNTR